jgi:hypothetical protein
MAFRGEGRRLKAFHRIITFMLPAYGGCRSTIVQHPQKAGEKKENLISQSTYTWNDTINIEE